VFNESKLFMKKNNLYQEIPFSWEVGALALIVIFVLFQLLQWEIFPLFLDIFYHLCVMAGFHQAGGYVSHAFWEYAPFGRPHLYPPLLHILMLFFYKMGMTKLFLARFFNSMIYPLLLITVWWTFKKLFSARFSFFVLVVFTSSYGLYLSVMNLIPFSLVLIFWLFIFLCMDRERRLSAVLLLALSFYTHIFAAGMIVLSLLIYGVLRKEKLKSCLKVGLSGILLAAPFLFFQFIHRGYFHFIRAKENATLNLNILIYLLAAVGLWICLRQKKKYSILLAITLGLGPLFFTHQMRGLSGIGITGFVLLAALAVDSIYQKLIETRIPQLRPWFLLTVCLSFYLFSPVLFIDRDKKIIQWDFFDSSFTNLFGNVKEIKYVSRISIYQPKYQEKILESIMEFTQPDEIIWSDIAYSAGVLSYFSGRATSSAMLAEVRPSVDFYPLKVAKLVIWFKEPNLQVSPQFWTMVKKYRLRIIKETELAYICLNPETQAKRRVPKPLIPTALLFAILLIVLGLIIYDNRRPFLKYFPK